jgi:hypothetical protein
MPRISSYNQAAPAELTDKLIGTEISADNATKNFTIGSLLALFNSNSVPSTMTSPGTEGQIAADVDYLYICVADDTWRRVALSTF